MSGTDQTEPGIDAPCHKDYKLVLIPEDPPWNVDYYICPFCCGTYTVEEVTGDK